MNKFFVIFLIVFISYQTFAQPSTITYQGVLTDDSGDVISGTENIKFDIYTVETGGSSLWTETHGTVAVSKGLFNVELGSVTPFGSLDFSQELWLEITVDGTTLTPRIAFNASGYAKYGEVSTNLAGGSEGSIPYQSDAGTTEMLAKGDAGQVLTMNAGATAPEWASPASAPVTSVSGKTGAVSLAKGDVGLANVDNTSDANKPISTATQTALDGKVDEVTGKGLSTEDYTSAEKTKLAGIEDNANDYAHPTGDGELHVPATGTNNNGKVLTAGATAGSFSWEEPPKKYQVGDFAQGGIVFWVDETGQHGLVAAKVDQDGGSGIQWYNGSNTDTEAHGDGVYGGEMNTMLIIANQGSNSNDYAAGVCANYTVTESGVTYGDWYLPSKEELNLMYQNKATINATAVANGGSDFASADYWSSTEDDDNHAWAQYFVFGTQYYLNKDNTYRVRAVRAF